MSDTPRTDAFEALTERPINWWDFARQMERENAVLRTALDQQANYQRELRADRDRLDWLGENTEITIRKVVSGLLIFEHNEMIWLEDKGKLRQRIDAARKDQP